MRNPSGTSRPLRIKLWGLLVLTDRCASWGGAVADHTTTLDYHLRSMANGDPRAGDPPDLRLANSAAVSQYSHVDARAHCVRGAVTHDLNVGDQRACQAICETEGGRIGGLLPRRHCVKIDQNQGEIIRNSMKIQWKVAPSASEENVS